MTGLFQFHATSETDVASWHSGRMTDPYRIRSSETWDLARDAYLSGETAESVCARFDLGLTAFRTRARDNGWRRSDQSDPQPVDPDDGDDGLGDMDDRDLERLCRLRMVSAARRGHVGEALRWSRLGEAAVRQATLRAREEARADRAENQRTNTLLRDITASARTIEASVGAVLAGDRISGIRREPHNPHDPHPVFDEADADTPSDLPQNRAERRRMDKAIRKRR